MHSKSGEVGQVGEQSHGKEMWLQIFGKEVLFVSEMFPATTSLSHNVMCTQERLSMSSPKSPSIEIGKESNEGRKTRETFN